MTLILTITASQRDQQIILDEFKEVIKGFNHGYKKHKRPPKISLRVVEEKGFVRGLPLEKIVDY